MACCGPKETEFPRRMPDGALSVKRTPKVEERTMTDGCCCMVFLVCLSLMGGLVAVSVYFGDVKRLTHQYDYAGRLCGVGGTGDKVFFCGSMKKIGNFPEAIDFQSRSCVAHCPNATSAKIPCVRPPTIVFNETYANSRKTYKMDVHQTVELGDPYDTEQLGKFCIPTGDKQGLREQLLYGPLRAENTFQKMASSFLHAWPVLIGTTLLALVLGLSFLFVMNYYAGPLILVSMAVATILLAVVGVFFSLALFDLNVEDENSTYNKLNPIVHTFMGNDGRLLSVLLGFVLIGFSVCMGFTTRTALPEIDKSIGIVSASLECIFDGERCCSQLIMEAMTKAVLILLQLVICMIGLALMTSVGYLQSVGVDINGLAVHGLQMSFQWYSGWELAIAFYVFMCWWLFEVQVARYQFTVTYAVCQWYFVPPEKIEGQPKQVSVKASAVPRQVSVRLGGAGTDPSRGGRQGVRVKTGSGQEVVVVGIGPKGPPRQPDAMAMVPDNIVFSGPEREKKDMPAMTVCGGNDKSLKYHLGSLARGAIIVSITRPFRLLATSARALIGKSVERTFAEDSNPTLWASFTALINVVVIVIETFFSGVSKNAYCAIVLGSVDFDTAAKYARAHLEDAGGSIAFMHGATGVYEIVGVILISMICGLTSMILFTSISCFTDPKDAQWYVEDTDSMVFAATAVAAIVAYGFMSLFNITIDALLYVFSWGRKMKIPHNEVVCPEGLKSMLNPTEFEDDPDSLAALARLQPRGKNVGAAHVWHSLHAAASNAYDSAMKGTQAEKNPLLSTAPAPDGI